MKNIIPFFALLLLGFSPCQAEEKELTYILSDRTPEQTKQLGYATLTVARGNDNGNGTYDINVTLQNELQGSELLYLFRDNDWEKMLKKKYRPVKIKLDKTIPGKRGARQVSACPEMGRQTVCVGPDDKEMVINLLNVKPGEQQKMKCPVYIAKYKNKKKTKVLLYDIKELELNITLDKKNPEPVLDPAIYTQKRDAVESLKREMERKTFCPNSKHRPSIREQKKPYQQKIIDLKAEIDEVIKNWQLTENSKDGKSFYQLKEELDEIVFKEKCCAKCCSVPPIHIHKCDYCGMTAEEISRRMAQINTEVYNTASVKGKYKGEMNAMYNCIKDNKKRTVSGGMRKKIEDQYRDFNK